MIFDSGRVRKLISTVAQHSSLIQAVLEQKSALKRDLERRNVDITNIKADVDRLGKLLNGDSMNQLLTHVDELLQADEDFRSLSAEV